MSLGASFSHEAEKASQADHLISVKKKKKHAKKMLKTRCPLVAGGQPPSFD